MGGQRERVAVLPLEGGNRVASSEADYLCIAGLPLDDAPPSVDDPASSSARECNDVSAGKSDEGCREEGEERCQSPAPADRTARPTLPSMMVWHRHPSPADTVASQTSASRTKSEACVVTLQQGTEGEGQIWGTSGRRRIGPDDYDDTMRVSVRPDGVPEFHLRVYEGKYVDSVFKIPCLAELPGIGRSRRNAVSLLGDDQSSRMHAHFDHAPGGGVLIRDGSPGARSPSSNGTFVNSNCSRIGPEGYVLHYGDVISIGSTDLHVLEGSVSETLQASPPVQAPARGIVWDTKPPGAKRSSDRDSSSQRYTCDLTVSKKLAVLMSTHQRLGSSPNCFLGVIIDCDLMAVILSQCAITVSRRSPPAMPHAPCLAPVSILAKEVGEPLPLSTLLYPGGPTAQEYLDKTEGPGDGTRIEVIGLKQILSSTLWRLYHWRKQQIVEGLSELPALASSQHLAACPMRGDACLDRASNEYLLFHGLGAAGESEAGLFLEAPKGARYGGGIYLSDSGYRADSLVACQACGGMGAARCICDRGGKEQLHAMVIARVVMGDAHVAARCDDGAYRGREGRLRTRAPLNDFTGRRHECLMAENQAADGECEGRDVVVYDRFQCYADMIVHYRMVAGGASVSEGARREEPS